MKYTSSIFFTERRRLTEVLMVMIIAGGLGLLQVGGVYQLVSAAASVGMRPLMAGAVRLVQQAQTPWRLIQTQRHAIQRIQDLEARYAEMSAQTAELLALRKENEALRKVIESRTEGQKGGIIVAPIVSLAFPAVAAGERDGLRESQPVLINQTVVGTIGSLSQHQAEVRLLSARGNDPLLARTESGVEGMIVGDGRHVLLTELPLDVEVVVGELVVTSGQASIDRDILVGRVRTIRHEPSDPVQTAIIDQVVSFYDARVVEVR